jgi:hypothetical protein
VICWLFLIVDMCEPKGLWDPWVLFATSQEVGKKLVIYTVCVFKPVERVARSVAVLSAIGLHARS